ncbi:hypothetical protein [Plantibacter sp. CFBP 8804]|uniref:hypothetical protein n=1 Tax=Plantibacter sp. CFBP 8804 TaxID=2775270 RepID=UPI001784B24E|nr:hypothetical protein [Plantibacter sp. CFBP 8804]MBD8518862.1 hypothetical protein [Plantibacter sp. CFBP 8804]
MALLAVDDVRRDGGEVEVALPRHAVSSLLMPVAVDRDGRLLAGGSRLEFAREAGWTHVDARVWESVDDPGLQLQIEWERSLGRADVPLLTQARYVREVLRPVYDARVALQRRQVVFRLNSGAFHEGTNLVPSSPGPVGKWREYVGARVSVGGTTMLKFLKMQDWAAAAGLDDDARAAIRCEIQLANDTGRVDSPFRRAKTVYQAAAGAPETGGSAQSSVSRIVLQIAKTEIALAKLDADALAATLRADPDAQEDFQAGVESAYRVVGLVDELLVAMDMRVNWARSA